MKLAIYDNITGAPLMMVETNVENAVITATLWAAFGYVHRVLDYTSYVICNDPKFLPTLAEFDALWPTSPE